MAKRKMRKKIGEDDYGEKEDVVNLNLNRRSCPTKSGRDFRSHGFVVKE
jgi:hypothetical protein